MPAGTPTIEQEYNSYKSLTVMNFATLGKATEKAKLEAIRQTAFAVQEYNQRAERIELTSEVLSELIRQSNLFTEQEQRNPSLIQKIQQIFPYTPAAAPPITPPAATVSHPKTASEPEKDYTLPLQHLFNKAKRSGKGTWLFKTPKQKIKAQAEIQLKVQTKAEFKSIIALIKDSDALKNESTPLRSKLRQSHLKGFEKNLDKNVALFIKNNPNNTDSKTQSDFILNGIQAPNLTQDLKKEMEGKLNNAENPHRQSIKELEDYIKEVENKKVFLSNKNEKIGLAENILQAIDLESKNHTPLKNSDIKDYIRQNKKHNFYFKREDRLDDILHNINNELSHRPTAPKESVKPT